MFQVLRINSMVVNKHFQRLFCYVSFYVGGDIVYCQQNQKHYSGEGQGICQPSYYLISPYIHEVRLYVIEASDYVSGI